MNIASAMKKYAPIVSKDDRPNEPGEVVGIISKKHRVAFVVSPHRDDRRHGNTSEPVPMSDYWKSMYKVVSIR